MKQPLPVNGFYFSNPYQRTPDYTMSTPLSPSDAFSIRPACVSENADRIVEIVGEVWHGGADALLEKQYGRLGKHPWQHYQSQAVLSSIRSPGVKTYVVEDTTADPAVVAFTSLQVDRERSIGSVGYNAVAVSHQGRRIGHLMMDHVMNRFRELGMGYARVVVAENEEHAPAIRVYEKQGFETVYSLRSMFRKL